MLHKRYLSASRVSSGVLSDGAFNRGLECKLFLQQPYVGFRVVFAVAMAADLVGNLGLNADQLGPGNHKRACQHARNP